MFPVLHSLPENAVRKFAVWRIPTPLGLRSSCATTAPKPRRIKIRQSRVLDPPGESRGKSGGKSGGHSGKVGVKVGSKAQNFMFWLLLPLLSHCDPYFYPYFYPYFPGGSRTLLLPYFNSSGFWGL